jgi:hypothetical protein
MKKETEKWVQVDDDKVELSKFTRLPFYNVWDQEVTKLGVVYFGIHKGKFIIFNDEKMKILNIEAGDNEYTYKFLKTKVKCSSEEGLIRHFMESARADSAFNASSHAVLTEVLNIN